MGYATNYDFSKNSEEVVEAINEISGYEDDGYGEYFSVKWYGHEDHIKNISLSFPDELITVSGEGEEQGDTWITYAKDGKMVKLRPEMVWPEFDETMLK